MCTAQQVADLFRDKLQTMCSELFDAWSRITELEEHFTKDKILIAAITSELQRTRKF
jgi:hypothetical protein